MPYLLSAVITGVLVLQAVATFDMFPRLLSRPSAQFWPFTDYPMYRYAQREGALIASYRVIGRLMDGAEVEMRPEHFGLNFRKFNDHVVGSIRNGDHDRLAKFANEYKARNRQALVAVRLERSGYFLTRAGLKAAPVTQIATMPIGWP